MDIIERTAIEIRDALAGGELRCVDLAEAVVARTQAAQSLNCYVEFDAAGLRRQAQEADERLAAGQRLPLLGVPIALKDNIQARGLACGNGTRALHGRVVSRDAALVQRLREAGALVTGKLGMHELAFGITSNNAVTGAIRNPWDRHRIPGGSSGGCGAAVAARVVPAAIGTDTGGSVRVPAALCGVVGFRPGTGRVPGDGIAPISSTRDTAGPIARSVADLALLDGVLTGQSTPLQAPELQTLTIGIPTDHFWAGLDPGVEARAREAIDVLREAGVRLVEVPTPTLSTLDSDAGFAIALYEFVRDMRRYLDEEQRGVAFDELVAAIGSADVAAIARPLLGDGAVPEAAYHDALASRRRLQSVYESLFASSQVDALAFPTTPATAARIGEDEQFAHVGALVPTFGTFIRNTSPGSVAGIPGLTVPVGLAAGLPVGLAFDGPAGGDRRLLAIGLAIEAALPPMPAPRVP